MLRTWSQTTSASRERLLRYKTSSRCLCAIRGAENDLAKTSQSYLNIIELVDSRDGSVPSGDGEASEEEGLMIS